MSFLRFDKTQMTNLQESLMKEFLLTNKSGAYCSSTLTGCNIRKYHGLFVVPVPALDDENHVLLSSLDETVVQHGAEFNLGLHKYVGDNFSPRGHKYIQSFEWDKVPTWIYRIGGVVLKKEIIFRNERDRRSFATRCSRPTRPPRCGCAPSWPSAPCASGRTRTARRAPRPTPSNRACRSISMRAIPTW